MNPDLKTYFDSFNLRNLLGFAEPVNSTLVGQVNQILSQMKNVKTQSDFITSVVCGLTSNYLEDKIDIINKIFEAFNQANPFSAK